MIDPDVALALRRAYPAVLAKLLASIRVSGTGGGALHDAQDALQEAVARALTHWARDGLPQAPEAWLLRTARNVHVDGLRHARVQQRHRQVEQPLSESCPWSPAWSQDMAWDDDLLRLLFTCCDPALQPHERVALTLSTVVGMSCGEVAHAFLVAPGAMEQRLVRARRRLRESGTTYEVPAPDQLSQRLPDVLAAIHLLFNEGYWSTSGETPIRRDLCRLALSLATSVEALVDEPECTGLRVVMVLAEARADARLDAEGAPVPLPEQDRTRWDTQSIARASGQLQRALERGRPGPYQIEASIACVHCAAADADATDWVEIALLYESLECFRGTPVVRVHRAFAEGQAHGAQRGLSLLDTVLAVPRLQGYPYLHLVHGALLELAGELRAADMAYARAEQLSTNRSEAEQVRQKRARLALSRPPDGAC